MIGERTRHALAAAKARGIKLGNPEQAKINRAKAAARAQALRPHIERCIKAGRTSSSAIATDLNARGIAAPNGGHWFPMQVRRVRDRLGL
jgi:DNA invertase Pin-like site-specific DNA recombinase